MKDLTLILVRVGPTMWDVQGRLCGCTDVPPANGCIEALRMAIGVLEPELELVLHGPGQIAETLAGSLAEGSSAKPKALQDLEEVGLGLWEGMLQGEAERRYPTLYRQWRLDPALATPPEGEPIGEAQERLLAAVRKGVGRVPSRGRVAAVLLRPLAFGALVTALEGSGTSGIWNWIEGPDRFRRLVIPGGDLKGLLATHLDQRARVGA